MIMVAPLTTALMRSVPVNHSGIGSAVNNAISRVGPQLMGALLFVAISASFYSTLQAELPDQDLSSRELRQEIAPLNQPKGGARPEVVRAANESSARSFHVAMGATAALCLLGAAVNGVGIRNEELRQSEGAVSEPVPA
jgi:hypothetical protein